MPVKPMGYEEMVEQGIEQRQTSRVFSVKNSQDNDIRLSELVYASAEDLAKAAEAINKIHLGDTNKVKARTLLYVRACAEAGNLPTFSGFMRSIGMTADAAYVYMRRHPGHDTTQWLQMYQEYCGDLLADAALRGMTHPVFSIFVEKSRNMWRDTITIEQATNELPYPERSQEEIRAQLLSYLEPQKQERAILQQQKEGEPV